jgi:methionyl-tRNA formyltransferase
MRVVFAGTPAFAAEALSALLSSSHQVVLVLTQPDRPAGRGMKVHSSPVKELAGTHGLPVYQPVGLKDPQALSRLGATRADAMVVAAYGLILPPPVLDLFPHGCINIHASLLPRWRGAAPIQRALLANDAHTGVCIMRMAAGLDTGPVYLCDRVAITPASTAGSLHDELAARGARLLLEALDAIAAHRITPRPQPPEGVTYATKIAKEEAVIDWKCPAESVDRQIRAFNPVPGASTTLGRETIKIWRGTLTEGRGTAGEILGVNEHSIVVACGQGALAIAELQRAGGKRLGVREFLRGFPLAAGSRFGAAC